MSATIEALYTARRANLRALAAAHNGPVALAKRLGYGQSYLSQMIGPNPRRPITERTARAIETKMRLPMGWLDNMAPRG